MVRIAAGAGFLISEYLTVKLVLNVTAYTASFWRTVAYIKVECSVCSASVHSNNTNIMHLASNRDQQGCSHIPLAPVSRKHSLAAIEMPSNQKQFKKRQKEYFTDLLGRRWDCDLPGHTVCVPTEDGQHHQLSQESFLEWVNALVRTISTINRIREITQTWKCSVLEKLLLHSLPIED